MIWSDSESEIDSGFLRLDLRMAREGPKAFIPQNPPSIPGLECEMFYKPAHSVSGDYQESSLPYQITNELETLGVYDFAGKLADSMTAHPKICPRTWPYGPMQKTVYV
jgi:hypothetical protein